jgi:hypothetical protein
MAKKKPSKPRTAKRKPKSTAKAKKGKVSKKTAGKTKDVKKDRFWELITASRRGFDPDDYQASRDEQVRQLHQLLSALPLEEVRDFDKRFAAHFNETSSAPNEGLWAVAYDIGGGCSNDAFEDFRSWLISMGQEVFEAALRDPKTVFDVAENEGLEEDVFFEEFQYVSERVLREKTGEGD